MATALGNALPRAGPAPDAAFAVRRPRGGASVQGALLRRQRGGARMIYYWMVARDRILLLDI